VKVELKVSTNLDPHSNWLCPAADAALPLLSATYLTWLRSQARGSQASSRNALGYDKP
jgi:hypothetical protein